MFIKQKNLIVLSFWVVIVLFLTVHSFADEIKVSTLLTNILWQKDSTTNNIYAPNTLPVSSGGTDAKVGIGTNNPKERLDIDGAIRATGFVVNYNNTKDYTGITPKINPLPDGDVTIVTDVQPHYDVNNYVDMIVITRKTLTFINGLLVNVKDELTYSIKVP